MKKGNKYEWSEFSERAFEEIKAGLLKPPTLLALMPDKPLIMYISHIEAALAVILAQVDDLGRERLVYYFSRAMGESVRCIT